MKQVRFEFEELPYETLSQFGLTQEMIEDLPMHILEELSHGRHSPVLPIKVNDDNGNTVTDRSRFAFVRKENGEADVVFYPVLKKSSLEKYSEEQQKQLRSGKVILADTVTADGRKTKAFVQIDTETNQVMSVPTQVIARNLQVMAEELASTELNCHIIPRKADEDGAISASEVRCLIRDGNFEALKKKVPACTFQYFTSEAAEPVIQKIRSAAEVRHY